jgi:glycosyltransferase involved in cell wall biosynthesis
MSDPHPAAPPLASVIVPCRGQLPYTRACLAALARHTRPPWELIVVDDGSDDGTPDYLAGLADVAPFPVTVLRHDQPRGFPAACNAGLAAARGESLVLLNNDAVVTDAWLDQLIALTAAGPRIGLAGPMSNYARPPQLVPEVPYDDLDAMHRFAHRWRQEHRGQWFTAESLSGFCLLLTRAAWEAIGGLDERFGPGFCDDDDLCLRARAAGFELAVACDLFVHHFGSRTIASAVPDADALLGQNRRLLAEKWGDAAPAGRPVTLAPSAVSPRAAGRPTVSLTMIVRDEEHNLPDCLASVRGLFDEVVVVDTGSVDRTAELACELGARVVDFPWVDDFAAARNAALGEATGDYAFWLDADDRIEPGRRPRLAALLAGLRRGDEAAYVVRCACDPDERGRGGQTVVDHVRLFPLRPDVRWDYRVHEQILPALRRAGVPVRWSDVVVRHVGYADAATRRRKLDRDRALLDRELQDRPDDPFVRFNLGAIAVEREDWAGALGHLEASMAGSAPGDSIVRKLHALIARARQGTGDLEAGLLACARGLEADPDDAELLVRRAVLHRHAGDDAAAEASWRRILGLRPPERFASIDVGIYGHLTRRNLAALAHARGDRAEARRLWEAVLAECPGDPEAAAALGIAPGGPHRAGGEAGDT